MRITTLPKRWIGRFIIAISVIHTAFALLIFSNILHLILADGVFNTIGEDPMRGAVAWFVIAGFFMAVIGIAVDILEQAEMRTALRQIGWSLLAVSALGAALMPASGFWLLIVAAIAMIRVGAGAKNNKT